MGTVIRFVHTRETERRERLIREGVMAEVAALIAAGETEAAETLLRNYLTIAMAEAASDGSEPDVAGSDPSS